MTDIDPEDLYYEHLLDQLVSQGMMEEVSPGKYRLTEAGKAWVEERKDEPWVKEIWRQLDEAHFGKAEE